MLVLRSMFDETLALTFQHLKKERMPIQKWWGSFGIYARVLGDTTDFEKILQEDGAWSSVSEPLLRVTSRTKLGAKMFGGAAQLVLVANFSSQLDAELLGMKGQAITEAMIDSFKD
eukprot:15432854-Alexandrium_andersonii.AAC.1